MHKPQGDPQSAQPEEEGHQITTKIKTVDVLHKVLNTAEASWDPGLVSAAGIGAHRKDEHGNCQTVLCLFLGTKQPRTCLASSGHGITPFSVQESG